VPSHGVVEDQTNAMSQLMAYVDGACRVSNPGLAASSFVVYDGDKEIHTWAVVHPGLNTNNYSEYMALTSLLYIAEAKGWRNMVIYSDSKLVVMQSTGEWAVREEGLKKFANGAAAGLIRGQHALLHMRGHEKDPREALHAGNNRADELCNEVLDSFQAQKGKDGEVV
jgi:ribonuclease HI